MTLFFILPHVTAKFVKSDENRYIYMYMRIILDLKLSVSELLLANPSKSTSISVHNTKFVKSLKNRIYSSNTISNGQNSVYY